MFIIQNYTGTANEDVTKCLIFSISFEIKMHKYSFGEKNHTHVKKVVHNPEFLFGIYWLTWKTTIYLKNCWSGPIKNVKIFIFTLLYFFFKKIKKNTWRCCLHMCTKNLDDMIHTSWDRLKLVNMGHFFTFYPSP